MYVHSFINLIRLKNDALRDFGAHSAIATPTTTVLLPYGHILKISIPGGSAEATRRRVQIINIRHPHVCLFLAI